MRKWTDEERAKQAEICRRNKPWEQSTGPRTVEGKSRSKMNAYTKGYYTGDYKIIRDALATHRRFMAGAWTYFLADTRRKYRMALRERTDMRPNENKGLEGKKI